MADEYLSLVKRVLKSKKLTRNQKLELIFVIENSCYLTKEELQRKEDMSYTVDGKPLKPFQRIGYELDRLLETASEEEEAQIKKTLYRYFKRKDEDRVKKAKISITKMQIMHGITPSFYTVFQDFVEELNASLKKTQESSKHHK